MGSTASIAFKKDPEGSRRETPQLKCQGADPLSKVVTHGTKLGTAGGEDRELKIPSLPTPFCPFILHLTHEAQTAHWHPEPGAELLDLQRGKFPTRSGYPQASFSASPPQRAAGGDRDLARGGMPDKALGAGATASHGSCCLLIPQLLTRVLPLQAWASSSSLGPIMLSNCFVTS